MGITLKTINDRLAAKGHQAHLESGDGYFYFYGGEVTDWLDRIVKVPTLSSVSAGAKILIVPNEKSPTPDKG